MTASPIRLVCLGGGHMAQALLRGLLQSASPSRPLLVEQLIVVEPLAETRQTLQTLISAIAQERGITLTIVAHLDDALGHPAAHWLLLAIKPQQVETAFEDLSPAARQWLNQARLLSVAAGLTTARLAVWSGLQDIVRTMPNTPALIGEGMTGLYATPSCSPATCEQAEAMMAAVGEVAWFDREAQLDAVTALSGSGPAYLFRFVEALTRAGEALGLTSVQAERLATQTMKGAALMLANSDLDPAALREQVTSRGGTTAAALAVFEGTVGHPASGGTEVQGLDELVLRALTAARNRSQELAQPEKAAGPSA